MPRAVRERYLWLGLALAALLPRALAATLRPPWHDEYFTVWATGLPLSELIAALRLDSGPPLPYLLVRIITVIGVPALIAARALAVAAGTAAVLLAARAARRAFGTEAGWWTGAFLAFHPLAIAWSSEGRAYALLLLAAAWAWERLGALENDQGTIGLGAAVALACWCHGLGLLLAAVVAAVGMTLPRPQRLRALTAAGVGLASHIPWLPVAAHQPPAAIAWMAAFWRTVPPVPKLAAAVRLLSPLGGFGRFLDLPSPPVWAEAGGAVLLLALLASACRRREAAWRPLLGVLLPAGVLAAVTAIGGSVFYPGRGEALYLAPCAFVLGVSAARSRPLRAAAALLVAAAVAVSTLALVRWAGRPPTPEQRLASELRSRMPGGGEVVIGGYWRLGISYHLGDERSSFRLINYPAEAALHPGWYEDRSDTPAPGELARLLAALRPVRSCAVVVTPGLSTTVDLDRLAAGLGLQSAVTVPGGRLWVPTSGEAPR
ncbi:MAG TPA: glycosyltransferase family 39 protein [Thermoanaerobaculaceae bacterium]|nr:glycosyltransferase family 39 protein [Thermoanaerobaculaceae bacterium]